jgi:hypothetical protein
MIRAMFGGHALFTLSDRTLEKMVKANDGMTGFHIHVAEGMNDVYDSLRNYGCRPVNRLLYNGLLGERTLLMQAFKELPSCEEVYPTDANFFLARMTDAQKIYDYLVDLGIIVRNRTKVQLCKNCLRITIGTRTENQELLAALRQYE